MQTIYLTIERKGLIRKEDLSASISFSSEKGLVFKFPENYNLETKKDLESKLRQNISLQNHYVQSQCIAEETSIANQIVKDLKDRRFNGSLAVTDVTIFTR